PDEVQTQAGFADEGADEQAELVDSALRVGSDAPVVEQFAGLEQAEHGFGVPDVEDEDHDRALPRVDCRPSTSRMVPLRTATAGEPRSPRSSSEPSAAIPCTVPR